MKVAAFTSNNAAYLPNARILAKSVKHHHPEWDFYLLFNDRAPFDYPWDQEPFDCVVPIEKLDLGQRQFYRWVFQYNVIELCTATKGSMARHLIEDLAYDVVIYLDPDTRIFSRLEELLDIMKSGVGVVLTPHLTDPEEDAYSIWSHEIAALKHGTFNLGFFAFQNTDNGLKALRWWAERLLDYSRIDFEQGLFTDQKWANLLPYMFNDVHVMLNKTYNVATWNMKNRKVTFDQQSGSWLVNGELLRFYHFSGFGRDFAWANHELEMLKPSSDLIELWESYKREYAEHSSFKQDSVWYWERRLDGLAVTDSERRSVSKKLLLYPYEVGL